MKSAIDFFAIGLMLNLPYGSVAQEVEATQSIDSQANKTQASESPVGEEYIVASFGKPGANSSESVARLPSAIEGKVDHLVVLLGMNDAMNSAKLLQPHDLKENLAEIVAIARKSGIESIVLVTNNPIIPEYVSERHPTHPQRDNLQQHMTRFNAATAEVAKEQNVMLVDWFAGYVAASQPDPADTPDSTDEAKLHLSVQNRPECLLRCVANCGTADGVHLTPQGYQELANQVAEVLRPRLESGDRIVCFGDSLTFGSFVQGEGTTSGDTYPAFLALALSKKAPPSPAD